MATNIDSLEIGHILPHGDGWADLSNAVRRFDADVVVLVARKMPRLVDALRLNLGQQAIAVSDQAISFVSRELKNARVAIVDDVWNVGTTMLRARDRVRNANPRTIKLFALAAKDADAARAAGVNLTMRNSLTAEQRRSFVESVPRALKLASKPFDVDFPVVPCLITAPLNSWRDCWYWLQTRFGEYVHSTVDESQLAAGFARATVNFETESYWTIKARLYFDLHRGLCNVVPMALAPSLTLRNEYPKGSTVGPIFDALSRPLSETSVPTLEDRKDALARVNTFCDSLLFADHILSCLDGLLQRESLAAFSLDDVSTQFGPSAAKNCEQCFQAKGRQIEQSKLSDYLRTRKKPTPKNLYSVIEEPRIIARAQTLLQEGFATLAFDALLNDLAQAVGADNPDDYSLSKPYSCDEIKKAPYLRLRLGFSYQELLKLFCDHFKDSLGLVQAKPIELLVSALMDSFIDSGAIVPTFPCHGETCTRIYRKGEANPRWDEEIFRLQFALASLNEDDRQDLIQRGRTRIAKINAIMALSSAVPTSLSAAPFERGTVGSLVSSVVERHGGDLTGLMRRLGLLK